MYVDEIEVGMTVLFRERGWKEPHKARIDRIASDFVELTTLADGAERSTKIERIGVVPRPVVIGVTLYQPTVIAALKIKNEALRDAGSMLGLAKKSQPQSDD